MFDEDFIAEQLELLSIQRRTLSILIRQVALLGGEGFAQPGTLNGIIEAREHIQLIKDVLRENGTAVDDQPGDKPSFVTKPPSSLVEDDRRKEDFKHEDSSRPSQPLSNLLPTPPVQPRRRGSWMLGIAGGIGLVVFIILWTWGNRSQAPDVSVSATSVPSLIPTLLLAARATIANTSTLVPTSSAATSVSTPGSATVSSAKPLYATAIKYGEFGKVLWSTNLQKFRLSGAGVENKKGEFFTSENWLHMKNGAIIEAGVYYGYLQPNGFYKLPDKELYYENTICPQGCIDYVLFWAEHTHGDELEYFHVVSSINQNESDDIQTTIEFDELDSLSNNWVVSFWYSGNRIGKGISTHTGTSTSEYSEFGGKYQGGGDESCAGDFRMIAKLYDREFKYIPWIAPDDSNIATGVMNGTQNSQAGKWFWNKPLKYNDHRNLPCT